ncbi:hypothetical protein, partial [Planktothrix sp. FACHB-1365]|uniref:hypothetical protein n=1 Tax=Planktothrix sp. FACHB-1365 TaxID=2692855 RepID=UPI001684EE41
KVYSDGDGSGAISLEKITPDKYSEVQPVEIPQTEPENPPPSKSKKSEMTQAEKDCWFIENFRNNYGELDHFQRSAVDFISRTTGFTPVYDSKEKLLTGWEQLKPKSRYYVEVLIRATNEGERLVKKILPRWGITPTELGLSDPTPKPVEPDGDQMSLL